MSATRYVIIGNGVAGITAAEEIRNADKYGAITIIGDESERYYYRASLSEWISEDNTDDMVYGRTADFYKDMRLDEINGYVTSVTPDAKTVALKDGSTLSYDKLLIATGARAHSFPIEGLKESQVYRTWEHAREIKEKLGCCGRALILGGGILGLELAGALVMMGIKDVAVVQVLDFMGGPLLDKPAAEWLQARMTADGVALFIGDTVERVEGNDEGGGIAYFKSGKTWEFDLFVQSVGIRQRYPEVPGLTIGRGIQIDDHTRTNLPDIYAAGDCTETYKADVDQWRTTRIWLDCARQGRVAACNMTGHEVSLSEFPFFNASIIYDTLYAYIGEPHGEEGEEYVHKRISTYRKVRVVDGKLTGALLMGNRHGMTALYEAIGQPVAEYGEDVVNSTFPWNDLTGRDWDYLFY